MKVSEKSKNYAGNRAMNKIVHAEYRAFKRGNIGTGIMLAGASRAAGVANIIVGVPVTAVVATAGLLLGAVCIVGAVATAPLLVTKAAGIPLACGLGAVTGVGFAGLVVVALATSPLTQIVAPELTYMP